MKKILILYFAALPLCCVAIMLCVLCTRESEKEAYEKHFKQKFTRLLIDKKTEKNFYENILLNKKRHDKKNRTKKSNQNSH